jgi:hypothetical protein
MSTEAPADLKSLRAAVMQETGITDVVEVGIVGDVAHAARGGYHISGDDINRAGRFGSDFSTKRARDHFLPNPFACAVDIGDDWPRGGRAAWLRFGNNVAWELIHTDEMPSIRAINYSPDGTSKKRFDRANRADGVIDSTDTVTIHTHIEFWRDSEGRRDEDLQRLLAHVRAARDNTTLADEFGIAPPDPILEADVIYTLTGIPAGTKDALGAAATEGGQYILTPTGPINLTGDEFFSLPAAAQAVRIKTTWARAAAFCGALRIPATLSAEQFADFKAGVVPIVHDAAQTGAQAGIEGATLHAAGS